MLKVDPVLFEQVLFNLIDNAAKYAPEHTAIEIRGWRQGKNIFLSVADAGPGIPPDDTERVFDSFYRVRKADHVQAGTGLGLSICKGFIEAMGGSIHAENRSGRTGAQFTVSLPISSGAPVIDHD
jgi:two-component system sensor histidine kinase KdpD